MIGPRVCSESVKYRDYHSAEQRVHKTLFSWAGSEHSHIVAPSSSIFSLYNMSGTMCTLSLEKVPLVWAWTELCNLHNSQILLDPYYMLFKRIRSWNVLSNGEKREDKLAHKHKSLLVQSFEFGQGSNVYSGWQTHIGWWTMGNMTSDQTFHFSVALGQSRLCLGIQPTCKSLCTA